MWRTKFLIFAFDDNWWRAEGSLLFVVVVVVKAKEAAGEEFFPLLRSAFWVKMENKDKAKITTVTAAFIHRDDREEANCRVVEFMIDEITNNKQQYW